MKSKPKHKFLLGITEIIAEHRVSLIPQETRVSYSVVK